MTSLPLTRNDVLCCRRVGRNEHLGYTVIGLKEMDALCDTALAAHTLEQAYEGAKAAHAMSEEEVIGLKADVGRLQREIDNHDSQMESALAEIARLKAKVGELSIPIEEKVAGMSVEDVVYWRKVMDQWLEGKYATLLPEINPANDLLRRIQCEVGRWAMGQFANNVSKNNRSAACGHPIGELAPLLGMGEEVGELMHVVLYRHQGRGYDNDAEYSQGVMDALGDILVFMCDFACRVEVPLSEVLEMVWEKVQKRRAKDWAGSKAAEKETEDQRYARLEREHLGDPDRKTGIYHPDVRARLDREAAEGALASTTRQNVRVVQDGHGFGHLEKLRPVPVEAPTNDQPYPDVHARLERDETGMVVASTQNVNVVKDNHGFGHVGSSRPRTKSEVEAAKRSPGGCCNRNADNMGCDCEARAVPDSVAGPRWQVRAFGVVCHGCGAGATTPSGLLNRCHCKHGGLSDVQWLPPNMDAAMPDPRLVGQG